MSDSLQSSESNTVSFPEGLSGKWQIPLMAVALGLVGTALILARPAPYIPTLEEQVEHLRHLRSDFRLQNAEQFALSLLQDKRYSPESFGPVHVELANTQFDILDRRPDRKNREIGRALAHYEKAQLLGLSLSGDELVRRGRLYEWLEQPGHALEEYQNALQHEPSEPLEIRRRTLDLQMQLQQAAPSEIYDRLAELMEQSGDHPRTLAWALEQQVQLLVGKGQLDEAQQLLSRYESVLKDPPECHLVQYLQAWLLYLKKDYATAERQLRNLIAQLGTGHEMYARTSWLLGRVILSDDRGSARPLEALTFFEPVLATDAGGDYALASRLGIAESLSDLQFYDRALTEYRRVIEDLKTRPKHPFIDLPLLRNSLMVRSTSEERAGRYAPALDYLLLSAGLISQDDRENRNFYLREQVRVRRLLADQLVEQSRQADQAGQAEEAKQKTLRSRELYRAAARDLLAYAQLNNNDEEKNAKAAWEASQMYDAAGDRRETIRLMEAFLKDHPTSPEIPWVHNRLGQAYQAEGELLTAVDYYQRSIHEFPRTDSAQRSYIPLADCYVLLGGEYSGKAEEVLTTILDESGGIPGMFTPQSSIYRDALFKLGDLLCREGRYEESISRLEEALQWYPDDPRVARATFLLANAYRRSAMKLDAASQDMKNALYREELEQTRRQRLHVAEKLFDDVIRMLSDISLNQIKPIQQLQLMYSYMYRADCAYELSDYERALALYNEVVQVYPDDPMSLGASVQKINCLEQLGRFDAITPVLRQAEWLTKKIDEPRYQSLLVKNGQEDWQKFFKWLADTSDYLPSVTP